ncbi:MAG: rod shape-determining protein MreC [Flavobacteriaceae bacterium]|nr:rod shape-determining protein MreC [Flavobacteriaceae bacterium]
MQQIINFFIRNKNFLVFLLLFFIAFFLTVQSHSYHRSKVIHSANFLTGGIYQSINSIDRYFDLKSENSLLLEENNRLKSQIFNDSDSTVIDTIFTGNYRLIPSNVIKNSFNATNNYLTLDKGVKDSVKVDLGVITSKGIVGIIDNTSNGYARVLSILNTNSRVNAQLKKTDHFGTLTWDGTSPEVVQLIDIPKQAPLTAGDTIMTGGRSTIFPKGIPIGTVNSFQLDETENYYTVQIKLFNDMTNVGHVHIIENIDSKEIRNLEIQNE